VLTPYRRRYPPSQAGSVPSPNSSFEHTSNAVARRNPADRSVNSDQDAHLNKQSRRPRRSRAANPSEPSTAIKAQPHPALPGHPRTYASRLRPRTSSDPARAWCPRCIAMHAFGSAFPTCVVTTPFTCFERTTMIRPLFFRVACFDRICGGGFQRVVTASAPRTTLSETHQTPRGWPVRMVHPERQTERFRRP
jgi:hypothetical protein